MGRSSAGYQKGEINISQATMVIYNGVLPAKICAAKFVGMIRFDLGSTPQDQTHTQHWLDSQEPET